MVVLFGAIVRFWENETDVSKIPTCSVQPVFVVLLCPRKHLVCSLFDNVLVRAQVSEASRPSLHTVKRSLRTRAQVKCSRSIPCQSWRNQIQIKWNSTSSRLGVIILAVDSTKPTTNYLQVRQTTCSINIQHS